MNLSVDEDSEHTAPQVNPAVAAQLPQNAAKRKTPHERKAMIEQLLTIPSPVQLLSDPFLDARRIQVFVKRDDLIHPEISGNKWRKLKYTLLHFQVGSQKALLTFGGAYSNHIAATAAACKAMEIPSIGIIRGHELHAHANRTLERAHQHGMKLVFVPRSEYAMRSEAVYRLALKEKYGAAVVVPEGGASAAGVRGCSAILEETPLAIDMVVTACGTGTTAAGLLLSSKVPVVVGVSALKGGAFLRRHVAQLLFQCGLHKTVVQEKMGRFRLMTNHHFGGYAKHTPSLISFIDAFRDQHDIALEPTYTGKAAYALYSAIRTGKIPDGTRILLLHTGGLQGTPPIQRPIR